MDMKAGVDKFLAVFLLPHASRSVAFEFDC